MGSITSKLRDLEEVISTYPAISTIQRYRNGNRVKRFHTVDTLVGETVGHHSANMAILCVLLSEDKPSVALLMAALTHDMAEQFTGDIPATAKWASDPLKEALDAMERRFDRYWFNSSPLTPRECKVLKQADMLDLCFKALEEINMGNNQFRPILARGIDYLRTNEPLPATKQLLKEISHECK